MDETKVAAVAEAARRALRGDDAGLLMLPENLWGLAAHVLTHLIARRVAGAVPCSIDVVTFWTTDRVCTFEVDEPETSPELGTAAAMLALDVTAIAAGSVAAHDEWLALWLAVPTERRRDLLTVLTSRFTAVPATILKETAA